MPDTFRPTYEEMRKHTAAWEVHTPLLERGMSFDAHAKRKRVEGEAAAEAAKVTRGEDAQNMGNAR